jgi:hypothetical protein
MRTLTVKWVVMTLVLGSFSACAVDVPPQEDDAVGVSENALTEFAVAEGVLTEKKTPPTEDGCAGPRPPVRGCRIACKPCMIPECVDGRWTYERVEWDGCDSDPLPGPGCCTASIFNGCPAECHCCNYN